jgi:hypothetical protein
MITEGAVDRQPGNYAAVSGQSGKGLQIFAEHWLNNRLQMGALTLTKQTKIDRCEQVRVNWKTGVYATNASIIVTSEIGDETPGAALN